MDDSEKKKRHLEIISNSQLRALATINSQIIIAINNNGETSAIEEIVLKDAALTASILKVASSVTYLTHTNNTVKTIKDAIVRIGLDGLRSMCITISLIDSIPSRDHQKRKQLLKCLSKSIHAAIQSKNIARDIKAPNAEAIYITALLHNIGELAFYSSSICLLQEYKDYIEDGLSPESACLKLSGCDFKELSKALCEEWNLDSLSLGSLQQTPSSIEAKTVNLGVDIAKAIGQGWNSDAVKDVQNELISNYKKDIQSSISFLRNGYEEALREISYFCPEATEALKQSTISEDTAKQPAVNSVQRIPDQHIQMDAMDKIMALNPATASPSLYFKILVNAIYNGCAMERVVVATVKDNKIIARELAGQKIKTWHQEFSFAIENPPTSLGRCIENKKPIHMSKRVNPESFNNIEHKLLAIIGNTESFLVFPIVQSGKTVAILYTDMAEKKWEATENQAKACLRLTLHVSNALSQKQTDSITGADANSTYKPAPLRTL